MQKLCLHPLLPTAAAELLAPLPTAFITDLSKLSAGTSSKHMPHLTAGEAAAYAFDEPAAAGVTGWLVTVLPIS